MDHQWQYQIRINLGQAFAELARHDPGGLALQPLTEILGKHQAKMKSQYDAFADYVAEAEKQGIEQFPLYRWTKATLADPVKREKHSRSFTLHVDGQAVYAAAVADALEADLRMMVDGERIIQVSRHDTNPANNLPVPAEFRS